MRPERSNVFDSGDGVAIEEVKEMYQEQAILPGFNATFCNTTITPTCLRQLYNIGNFRANPFNGMSPKASLYSAFSN